MSKIMYMDTEYTSNSINVPTVYIATWTATSSAAHGVKVTDSLTLPPGVYIISIKAPVISISNSMSAAFSLNIGNINEYDTGQLYNSDGQDISTSILTLTNTTTIWVLTNSSANMTYTYLERGYLKAVRIGSIGGNNSLNEDHVIEQGTSDIWTYRKWASGIAECWGAQSVPSATYSANGGYKNVSAGFPSGLFITPPIVNASGRILGVSQTEIGFTSPNDADSAQTYLINRSGSAVTASGTVYWNIKGRWK